MKSLTSLIDNPNELSISTTIVTYRSDSMSIARETSDRVQLILSISRLCYNMGPSRKCVHQYPKERLDKWLIWFPVRLRLPKGGVGKMMTQCNPWNMHHHWKTLEGENIKQHSSNSSVMAIDCVHL